MRYIEPKDLTDMLNKGFPIESTVLFSGTVRVTPVASGCSFSLESKDLQLAHVQAVPDKHLYRVRYSFLSDRKDILEVIFQVSKDAPATLTHPSEGANRIEILTKSGQLVYLDNPTRITY